MKKEALQLAEYVLESEGEDFIQQLLNEPCYVEDGVISKEDIEVICGDEAITDIEADKTRKIYQKASLNPKCTHPYALAYRIWIVLNTEPSFKNQYEQFTEE